LLVHSFTLLRHDIEPMSELVTPQCKLKVHSRLGSSNLKKTIVHQFNRLCGSHSTVLGFTSDLIIIGINRHFKNAQLTINRHKGARGDTETKPNTYTSTFSVNA